LIQIIDNDNSKPAYNAGFVIYRDYKNPDRIQHAQKLAKQCKLYFAVSAELPTHLANKLAGIHLPESNINAYNLLKYKYPKLKFSCAAHSIKTICRAQKLGIEHILYSPIFQTSSHPQAKPIGLLKFLKAEQITQSSLVALGGITKRNSKLLNNFASISFFKN